MSEHSHTLRQSLYRGSAHDDGPRMYMPGEEITPTEQELDNYPHVFEPIDDADSASTSSSEPSEPSEPSESGETDETAESDEPEQDESAAESDSGSEESSGSDSTNAESENPLDVTVEEIQQADYPRLRSIAADVDDVSGRGGEDEIRQGLLAKATGGE